MFRCPLYSRIDRWENCGFEPCTWSLNTRCILKSNGATHMGIRRVGFQAPPVVLTYPENHLGSRRLRKNFESLSRLFLLEEEGGT